MSINPAQVERFRTDFATVFARALDGADLEGDAVVGLAVSGGPDSMALLALAAAAYPGSVRVATVDHGLREGAAEEARLVAEVCHGLGIPHDTLRPTSEISGSSLQRRAREARYEVLAAWARANTIYPILTAHHADDQAETLLMRLNRASGISGLSAIRSYRFLEGCVAVRPVLGWRRAELHEVLARARLPFVTDPSNTDPRHDRTRIRALLSASPELDPAALAASATFLGEAEEVIRSDAEMVWSEHWHGPDRPFPGGNLRRELQRRLVRRAILDVRQTKVIVLPAFDEASNVEPLLDALAAGSAATHGGVLVTPTRDGWTFRPAPPRRPTAPGA